MPDQTPVRSLGELNARGCRVLSDAGLTYADGAEERLAEIVGAATDISSSSQELAEAATDWGTTYSLVPTRSNIVRALDLRPDMKVLEIGCGCGPITRYLGEQCGTVDSVEPMEARAAVARLRTRDLDSVEVFVGTLDDVPAEPVYDVVVVVGVLEYVGQGTLDPAPYARFLAQCHAVLRDGGTLVLAIENPLGVKYIAGAVEDHTNRPFDSLEDYALLSPARTFTRRALDEMLGAAGFGSEFLAAFPDYKLPRAVMADELFRRSDQLAENLPRFPSPDYLVPRMNLADEALTWRTLVQSGVAEHFANSFVALARKGSGGADLWPASRLGLLFNSERRPEYAVRNEVRDLGDGLVLERSALHPELGPPPADGDVRHRPARSEPVVAGQDLLRVWIAEPDRRAELLRRWAELVPDEPEWMPVDLVPHNVVLTPDDRLVPIDQEWQVRTYDRRSVLVRGLVLSAVQVAKSTRAERLAPWGTVGEVVRGMAADIGMEVDDATFDRFVALESGFQAQVNTTDIHEDERRRRSAADLREMLDLTLDAVRGGERFDVQWAQARASLESHQRVVDALEQRVATLEQDLGSAVTRAQAAEALTVELRRQTPRGIARRVVNRLPLPPRRR